MGDFLFGLFWFFSYNYRKEINYMKTIKLNNGEDLKVAFSQHQYLVKNEILKALEDGVLNDKEIVSAFKVDYSDGNVYTFDIKRNQYRDNLYDCLKYFEKEQEYEKCGLIQGLIKKLNG